MTNLSRAANFWLYNKVAPAGFTADPITMESGRGASRRTAMVHHFADGAIISDGDESRIAAVWLCGSTTVDAFEVADGDDAMCLRCRLAVRLPSGPCVYRAFSRSGALLYIGSTVDAPQRIQTHMGTTKWWHEVARLTFEKHPTEEAVRKAEAEAIWDEPGIYNRGGVRLPLTPVDRLDGLDIEITGGAA